MFPGPPRPVTFDTQSIFVGDRWSYDHFDAFNDCIYGNFPLKFPGKRNAMIRPLADELCTHVRKQNL